MVNANKCTIKAAAKELGINYSTAKHIYKQHKLVQGESLESPSEPKPEIKVE
jgi:molybdenum-dependent DNA-binding transcriptional regulator ModE